ncbi:hypothetical protein Anas_07028 [Armadillidium nasatum]|uniref:DNA-PKcs N-terminal domain-containing protein n=1 Tax=Armadillidium nasatum TaxID=96803 RepID=A0A5N5SL26_9CRUS|nr:hypothetical protein Anas_07028 [Armadillidium nasatum]
MPFSAALDLIFNHGAKFAEHLLQYHEVLFKWFIIWCRSSNRDDHKVGVKAMDTFIVVLANALELQDDDNGQGVQIFKL